MARQARLFRLIEDLAGQQKVRTPVFFDAGINEQEAFGCVVLVAFEKSMPNQVAEGIQAIPLPILDFLGLSSFALKQRAKMRKWAFFESRTKLLCSIDERNDATKDRVKPTVIKLPSPRIRELA